MVGANNYSPLQHSDIVKRTSRTTEVNFIQDFVEKMFVQTQDHETVPTLAKLKKGDMWIQTTDDGEIQSPVFIKSSEM